MIFFVRQSLNRIFNFLGTDSAYRDLPKNKFFKQIYMGRAERPATRQPKLNTKHPRSTHASMLFLLYELGNGLEWVNNTGTLIPNTSEVYFLLCWASGRHFVKFFVRQPLNRIF